MDYLPASADSTQVAKIQDRLPGGEATELVVVYHRDGGLTAADKATAAGQVGRDRRRAPSSPASRGASRPRTAPPLMYPVASTEPGTDEKARDSFVDDVRDIAKGEGGLSVEVGGPGALATDAGEVYDSLGGPLLYTTVAVVAVLLILIYRSPFLWLVPLAVAGIADFLSMAVAYGLNQGFGTSVTGQSSGIMTILVFGAGTDYALLLVSRYREELRRIERPYDAMARRAAGLRARRARLLRDRRRRAAVPARRRPQQQPRHGPARHGRRAVALVAMMTLLPAVLVLLGRRVFWPLVPALRQRAQGPPVACSPRWAARPGAGRSPCWPAGPYCSARWRSAR